MMWGIALFLFAAVAATDEDHINETIDPAYLDELLKAGQYEKFAAVMGIENVDLVRPGPGSSEGNPMFNKGLEQGDIFLTPEQTEQARQGVHFQNFPGSRWNGTVYYFISDSFSLYSKWMILRAIGAWNIKVDCIKWKPYEGGNFVVVFYPGNGCWSHIGTINGGQLLSLQEYDCISRSTITHLMMHAIGFGHEHNRDDRDHYIRINWDNIPEEWRGQYNKNHPYVFGLQTGYDYYSIMHYPRNAHGNDKPAFDILMPGIDENYIGAGEDMTCTDLDKIRILYCN